MSSLLKRKHVLAKSLSGGGAPFSGLVSTANQVSYWPLKTNGNDIHGTNHLTNTNGVVFTGQEADFESTLSQYLSHPDPTPLGDEDWTYTLWFKRESFGVFAKLISKVELSPTRAYTFQIADWGGIHFVFGDDAKVVVGPSVNDTNWHFALAWHDAAADTLNLQLDNGAVTSIATAGIFPTPSVLPNVTIGGASQWPGGEHYFDGLIKMVGLWRRVLTAQERTNLWNSGNGLPY